MCQTLHWLRAQSDQRPLGQWEIFRWLCWDQLYDKESYHNQWNNGPYFRKQVEVYSLLFESWIKGISTKTLKLHQRQEVGFTYTYILTGTILCEQDWGPYRPWLLKCKKFNLFYLDTSVFGIGMGQWWAGGHSDSIHHYDENGPEKKQKRVFSLQE